MSYTTLAFLFFYKPLLHLLIFNAEYWDGLQVVPLLSLGFLFMGMNYFVNLGIILKNKTKYFLIPNFISAIINIILIYIFIPWLGFIGPAISTLFSQIIYVCIITYISQQLKNVKFELKKVFLSLFVAILLYIFGIEIEFDSEFINSLVRVFLLILYPFILYKISFFESIEVEKILKLRNYLIKYRKHIIKK